MHAEEETSILCYTELRISAVDLRIMSERILRDQICDHNWTPVVVGSREAAKHFMDAKWQLRLKRSNAPLASFSLTPTHPSHTYILLFMIKRLTASFPIKGELPKLTLFQAWMPWT